MMWVSAGSVKGVGARRGGKREDRFGLRLVSSPEFGSSICLADSNARVINIPHCSGPSAEGVKMGWRNGQKLRYQTSREIER